MVRAITTKYEKCTILKNICTKDNYGEMLKKMIFWPFLFYLFLVSAILDSKIGYKNKGTLGSARNFWNRPLNRWPLNRAHSFCMAPPGNSPELNPCDCRIFLYLVKAVYDLAVTKDIDISTPDKLWKLMVEGSIGSYLPNNNWKVHK